MPKTFTNLIEGIKLDIRRKQLERRNMPTYDAYATGSALNRGARLMHSIFRYRHAGHKSDYRALYLEPYHDFSRAPLSMNPAESMRYTVLADGKTLLFFLPIFAEKASEAESMTWGIDHNVGRSIAWYDTRTRRFDLRGLSPLIGLAQQYGVKVPRLRGLRGREMRAFFNRVQTAVYNAAANDPILANCVTFDYLNSSTTLYYSKEYALDQFLRVSIFAQAYGADLTWAEYKVLYAFRFAGADDTLDSAERWDRDTNARLMAQSIILNGLLTGDPADAKQLMRLHPSLFRDMYPMDEHDARRAGLARKI